MSEFIRQSKEWHMETERLWSIANNSQSKHIVLRFQQGERSLKVMAKELNVPAGNLEQRLIDTGLPFWCDRDYRIGLVRK